MSISSAKHSGNNVTELMPKPVREAAAKVEQPKRPRAAKRKRKGHYNGERNWGILLVLGAVILMGVAVIGGGSYYFFA